MIDYRGELEKRGLDTHQTGDNYIMMLCPFHDETNPSFSVSTEDGTFRCFGCEERGTFADLIAELDDVSVGEAIRQIKSDTKISDLLSVIEKGLEPEDEVISYFNERSFHSVFPPVWGTLGEDYLLTSQDAQVDMTLAKPRGLTREIVERFDGRWGERGKYAGRVIFPIRMPSGKILSYVGRTIYRKAHLKHVNQDPQLEPYLVSMSCCNTLARRNTLCWWRARLMQCIYSNTEYLRYPIWEHR